jgi:hypothetical protein
VSGPIDPDLGATPLGDGRCRFLAYPPKAKKVEVRLYFPHRVVGRDE